MRLQRRSAADILKVGKSRVWLDPTKREEIDKAITRIDVKKLIKKGYIKALPEKLHRPKERSKRRKRAGSRKGKKFSVVSRKRRWVSVVRALRGMLKQLKVSGQIDNKTYRQLRKLVKGGMFRSRSHLKTYMEQHDLLKKVEK
jgi:large subunit ribosomal protein L19e